MLFYREAISLGFPCLDRPQLRTLAMDIFGGMPDFVQRAIYFAVKNHDGMQDDEKRPLLKNMEQHKKDDWFIQNI